MVGDRHLRHRHVCQRIVIPGRPGLVVCERLVSYRHPSELSAGNFHRYHDFPAVFLEQRRGLDLRIPGAAIRTYFAVGNIRHLPRVAGTDVGRKLQNDRVAVLELNATVIAIEQNT